MTPLQLRQKLASGDPVFGTLIVSHSPRWPEVVRDCGLDFVFIDTEHIAIDRSELSWMCQTYAAIGLPPIVRIPSPDPYAATMALDGGAAGVVAPYLESAEQVEALRGAVKCRPIKGKKLQGILDGDPVEPRLEKYIKEGARNRLLVVNIESQAGVDALDEILAVPEIDAILIGPHDLSCSLGVPEDYDHPSFLAACETIFIKARAAGIGAGIHFWGDVAQQKRFMQFGANLIVHSADISLFHKHLRLEIDALRESVDAKTTPVPRNTPTAI